MKQNFFFLNHLNLFLAITKNVIIQEISKEGLNPQNNNQEKVLNLLYINIIICIVVFMSMAYFLFIYLKTNFIYVRN